MKILTWNLEGLNERLITTRALAVSQIILQLRPDVVLLQEVVSINLEILRNNLSNLYKFIEAKDENGSKIFYYCIILYLKNSFVLIKENTVWFNSSIMGRHLIQTWLSPIGIQDNKSFYIATAHLESTRGCIDERVKQLKLSWNKLVDACKNADFGIFGGDLNLRDSDLKNVDMPDNIKDIWEILGKPSECKYTWDGLRNPNIITESMYKPRLRLDRLYLYQKSDVIKITNMIKVGEVRVGNYHEFCPSDHFGLLVHFNFIK